MSKKTFKKSMAVAGENARETISAAAEKVGPLYDQTRDAVKDGLENLNENLTDVLERAADNKYVVEATRRGGEVLDTVREKADDLPDPLKKHLPEAAKPAKKRHRLLTCLGIAAVVGVVFLAVRQILMPKDDGWTPHEPSGAFGDDDVTTDFSEAAATEPATAVEEAAEVPAEPIAATSDKDYGEGAYLGTNPPEGYTIKGNERSMKYHTPDGAGYSRTNADVWFVSSEAAEAAGFTKAQR
ncbi:hypothetical protein PROPJV5_2225 [Propionibacterium ruminifibrarum]|uniref:Uncharacterized protein n=1 Tax=Propionibacterium ruminifibrarum TaxID=1962131 RepID=A0A375I765_9ACTN|nr:hypothetical protein PROPJV5_2225 [Propionibacterium ruminifibrarum]